jgi:hypothetical protein
MKKVYWFGEWKPLWIFIRVFKYTFHARDLIEYPDPINMEKRRQRIGRFGFYLWWGEIT